jgi:hypothetical protein
MPYFLKLSPDPVFFAEMTDDKKTEMPESGIKQRISGDFPF